VAFEQRAPRRRALEAVEPPAQRKAELRLAAVAGGRAPRVAERNGAAHALDLADDKPARLDRFARHRLRDEAATDPARERLDLVAHVADGEHVLAGKQVDGQRNEAMRRVGDRDRAVADDLGVADRLARARERMVRRDDEDELEAAELLQRHAGGQIALRRDADREVGLAGDERLPGPGEDFGADAQPRRRRHRRHVARRSARPRRLRIDRRRVGVERGAQVEDRRARDDVVDGNRELRFPAAGDALDAVGDGVDLLEQAAAFVEQFLACGGQRRLPRAAVEEEDVEGVLELADVVGEGGRDLAELARGGGEAAAAGNRVHHRQRLRGEDVARLGAGSCVHGAFILFERKLQPPAAAATEAWRTMSA